MTADTEAGVPADKPPVDELVSDAPARPGYGWLFVAAILAGSFLLFLVQPMIARMALPRIGGAPAVWNSAMLVYQALLLGGYAYAHWLGRFAVRRQAVVHLAVLAVAALWLPIGLMGTQLPAGADPTVWVPWLLVASIGPLFFAISAQAPLLQRWFASASGGRDPYALYAASNVGSFGGLIAYPLLVEPTLALSAQSWVWTAGYVLVALLVLGCALRLPRGDGAVRAAPPASAAPRKRRVLLWIALAIVPSGLMLATTTFLTTDIVAVPMLWVVPLGLYLLSFTIAFAARRGLADFVQKYAPIPILVFGGAMMLGVQDSALTSALMALGLLFVVSIALHARMYDLRPEPDRLTGFYLAMSFGGALGGVFAALVAPAIFDWTWEYPLLILAAGALSAQRYLLPELQRFWQVSEARNQWAGVAAVVAISALVALGLYAPPEMLGGRTQAVAFFGIAAIGIFAIGERLVFTFALAAALFLFGGYRSILLTLEGDARTRSYFGVYTVREYADVRTLAHGTTLHGLQLLGTAERERATTSYYVPGSGVGQALRAAGSLYGENARIGVVGLGTGTLACYARPGQQWTFFEIDPTVVGLAQDRFSFLRNCAPDDLRISLGDARVSIAEAAPGSIDMLVLDAFSSDAVPMHLMTEQAFEAYGRALSPEGMLVVHISNRYLDLEPVVEHAARVGFWGAAHHTYYPDPADTTDGTSSDWIVLSRAPGPIIRVTAIDPNWRELRGREGFAGWSDDYSSILPLLRIFHGE